jgi:hypothetical protein
METPAPPVRASGRPAARVYCTYFDSFFLARGIVMLRSLRRHDPAAGIVVLALDELCARVLHGEFGSDLRVIETETLHAADPALRSIRKQRSVWAYYMTQTPPFVIFTMGMEPQPEAVIFIDADTWFFGDPSPMFEEIGAASVAFSSHRFHAATRHLAIFGLYNAGYIYWRNDETGRRCLSEWRDDCLAWCDEQPQPDGRFMCQGYLNRWPERYTGVHIIQHPGANLAPWNVDGHVLAPHGDGVAVDGQPLIFYHFSGLNRDAEGQWYSFHPHLDRRFDLAYESIYRPYILALEAESRRLKEAYGIEGTGTVRSISEFSSAVRLGDAASRPTQADHLRAWLEQALATAREQETAAKERLAALQVTDAALRQVRGELRQLKEQIHRFETESLGAYLSRRLRRRRGPSDTS